MVTLFAEAALRVLDAGQELRSALAEGLDTGPAADRLATAIELSMTTFDEGVQAFEAAEETAPEAPEPVEDLLSAAVSQLWVANVAIGASGAVAEEAEEAEGAEGAEESGETGPAAGTEPLDSALATFAVTAGALPEPIEETRFGFEDTETPPADLPTAVAALRDRVGQTLTIVADRTAEILTKAFTALRDHGPEALTKAWKQLEERLNLGGIGGRLLRLGLRALEAALGALHRLVPLPALLAARERVDRLADALARQEPAAVVTRWALEIDGAAQAAEKHLARDGLQIGRLNLAVASLDDLGTRYGRLMELAGGASVAIVGIGATAGLLHLAIPHLPVTLAAAQLLVLGAAVVLGRDFVDAGDGPGFVRGVRGIVRAAVEPL